MSIIIVGDLMNLSDLMIEAVDMKNKGVVRDVRKKKNVTITKIDVSDSSIGEIGKYITVEFEDIMDKSIRKEVISLLSSFDELYFAKVKFLSNCDNSSIEKLSRFKPSKSLLYILNKLLYTSFLECIILLY